MGSSPFWNNVLECSTLFVNQYPSCTWKIVVLNFRKRVFHTEVFGTFEPPTKIFSVYSAVENLTWLIFVPVQDVLVARNFPVLQ